MEENFGVKFLRRCAPDEIALVKEVYDKYKPSQLQVGLDRTHWFNLYLNKSPLYDDHLSKLFHSYIQNLMKEFFKPIKMHVLSYGYLFSPKHCQVNQKFHYDYELQVSTMFITMTELTTQNSAQFIKFMPAVVKNQQKKFSAIDQLDLMELCESDSIQIHQLVCKPHSILHVKKGTIHRGIGNRASYDRPLFYINFSHQDIHLLQKQGAGIRNQNDAEPQIK